MSTRVTKNMLNILNDLADFRMLSLSQVAHLHFGGKRAARRRMQQLCDEKLVEILPGAPTERGGRPENLYGLSKSGLQMLKSKAYLGEWLIFEQGDGANLSNQVAHQLLLGWCRIHLVHLCREWTRLERRILTCNSPLALVPETAIPILRAGIGDDNGDLSIHFTPDAAFILTDTQQPKSVLFFLEVDMGTEPIASDDGGDIREKVLRYKQYFLTKGYKSYEQTWNVSLTGFRLLFVTYSASRMKALCSLTQTLSPSDFVWVTSADRMFDKGISGAIWARGGKSGGEPESILGGLSRPMPLPRLAE